MSTTVADLKVFNYVQKALLKTAYLSTCNEFYSEGIRGYFTDKGDCIEESKRLVKSWLELNERSYDFEYNKGERSQSMLPFVTWETLKKEMNAIQLLKYINCIIYNIDASMDFSEQEVKDYKFLMAWQADLLRSIVNNLTEYQNAEWSDFEGARKKEMPKRALYYYQKEG